MTSRHLMLAAATTVGVFLASPAVAENTRAKTLQPVTNFAEKPGCGMYSSCGRLQPTTLNVVRANPRGLGHRDMHEVLGNIGYRRGYTVFNVLDSVQ